MKFAGSGKFYDNDEWWQNKDWGIVNTELEARKNKKDVLEDSIPDKASEKLELKRCGWSGK